MYRNNRFIQTMIQHDRNEFFLRNNGLSFNDANLEPKL